MLRNKWLRVRRAQDRGCLPLSISGNPLWPLEELRNLRDPAVVADPEFTPLAIDALGSQAKGAFAPVLGTSQVKPPVGQRSFAGRKEYRIPHLVGGMPWRFRAPSGCRIVPDPEFGPLDFSFFRRG
jgi:hypothetical protein